MRIGWVVLGCLCLLVWLGRFEGRARGDEDRPAARTHFTQGSQHYDLGEYREALAEFKAAYRAYEEPTFLFNIAQCHRQLGDKVEAERSYRAYLRKTGNPPDRADVELLISRLEEAIAQENVTKASPPDGTRAPESNLVPVATPAPTATPPVASTPVTAAAVPAISPVESARGPMSPGRRKEIAGGVTAGVGAALLATGIAFGVLAHQDADDLTNADRNKQPYDPDKYSSGQTDNRVGIALITVGAVAVVAGTIVAILGARQSERARHVARASSAPLTLFSF